MNKVIVFDLGGTLMEYCGMPYSWVEYYKAGFNAIDRKYGCSASAKDIDRSVEILKGFNPRVDYREVEYSPEFIFSQALKHWNFDLSFDECAHTFYEGLNLKAKVFDSTKPIINKLKAKGYLIAALTDLPTAMPDELFKEDIKDLIGLFDLYVSSQSCGYRKPNPAGLRLIADYFSVPVSELIYIGDEDKDKLTAENAECKFICANMFTI